MEALHAMQTIADTGSRPVGDDKAQQENKQISKTARDLFDTFGKADNSTTRCVIGAALSGMTCEEYDQAEGLAISMAKAADAASGWKEPADAKGVAKYGPKQASMAVQASMRRQVFGCAKINLSAIVSVPDSGIVNMDTLPVFSKALEAARKYLKEAGLSWTGQPKVQVQADKAKKAAAKEWLDAEAEAVEAMPYDPKIHANRKEWHEQVINKAEEILLKKQAEAKMAEVKKVADGIVKKYGLDFALELADFILKMPMPTAGTEGDEAPM